MQFSKDHVIYTREASLSIVMAVLRVYKRNSTFMDLAELVDQISRLGLVDALQKYHNKPLEKEAKSIVAGPSFLQYLNKLFQIQISAGDIIQFESGNTSKSNIIYKIICRCLEIYILRYSLLTNC